MSTSNIMHLTSQNFSQELKISGAPILIDFWAPWCGPCRVVAPILDGLAEKYKGKLRVGKVNIDEEPALASQFRIMSIPTLLFFKDGLLANKILGARPADELEDLINKVI